ncbi:hypothetical protein DM02DRAFT_518975 [Periconia macrospinosa]|uniref:20S-pre-rRNA D-site endonuclease NOB1 n=1 Tax=Periconia macrospinosa TaxID=97972 RepID=A0A2V1E4S8_9PLEO|nr:hypothetical protein DM02DRAFT_518975 [Periconia macrospinosa]
MASELDSKPINSIIIDTGPLIRNTVSISTIIGSAEHLYTTPAIISEIRDAATRSRVETTLLPFLNIKTPTPASLEAVSAFARKTGDFSVLSKQDLGILALAYEIHCEKYGGTWGLRDEPGKEKENTPSSGEAESMPADSQVEAESAQQATTEKQPTELVSPSETASPTPTAPKEEHAVDSGVPSAETSAEQKDPPQTQTTKQEEVAKEDPATEPAEQNSSVEKTEQDLSNLQISEPPVDSAAPSTDSDDSDGDWITPSNLRQHQAKDEGNAPLTAATKQMAVATMTTDYAMQNVLLQMNLKLLSPAMQRVRHIRSTIMRCHACFLTTRAMDKQFCPRCGGPTLQRVTCSTDAKGVFRIHLAKNYQWNKRGNKYSVPKPIAGTANGKLRGTGGGQGGWGRDLVLAEDQKEYTRQVEEGKRSKARDLMDEDYLPGILTGDRGKTGGRPKVGAGRTINSKKRF